jgi:hypothetical protein
MPFLEQAVTPIVFHCAEIHHQFTIRLPFCFDFAGNARLCDISEEILAQDGQWLRLQDNLL